MHPTPLLSFDLFRYFWECIVDVAPCAARLRVLQTEHCTLAAPRTYIRRVRHPPQSSCDMSVPEGGTGVMVLHSAHRTFDAPCEERNVGGKSRQDLDTKAKKKKKTLRRLKTTRTCGYTSRVPQPWPEKPVHIMLSPAHVRGGTKGWGGREGRRDEDKGKRKVCKGARSVCHCTALLQPLTGAPSLLTHCVHGEQGKGKPRSVASRTFRTTSANSGLHERCSAYFGNGVATVSPVKSRSTLPPAYGDGTQKV